MINYHEKILNSHNILKYEKKLFISYEIYFNKFHMNTEIDPIHIGEVEDIDKGSVENFEYEEVDYAIFHLESGFFAAQGHCNCEDQAFLSESNIEEEELECAACGNIYSVVSGDPINNDELIPLRIYDISEENGNIYLNL